MLITFEGPEGAGKTTQIKRLSDRLTAGGVDVIATRQPGGEALGKSLRAMLLEQDEITVDPVAELLMMMADRAQSVSQIILPALRGGMTVLCDRYTDSSVAYQGYGRGIDIATVDGLNQIATCGLTPDLTILLDIDPALGLQRQLDRNRMERQGAEFHERVRQGFLALAQAHPERIRRVDASLPIDDVTEAIWQTYEISHRRSA